MAPKEIEQKMVKANCPVCGKDYQYVDKGWKQQTCGSYDCVTKYFAHGSDYKQATGLYDKQASSKQ
jgi:hypothetical protein